MITEFLLVVFICSVVEKGCDKEIIYPKPFKTHKECAIRGYLDSAKVINSFETDFVNNKKIYTKFNCIEKEARDA